MRCSPLVRLLALSVALRLFGAPAAAAEEVELFGEVRQQGTREPLPGIAILAAPASSAAIATTTDEKGRFRYTGLTQGSVVVRIRGGGIRPAEFKETLRPGRLQVIYYAVPLGRPFETVVRTRTLRREVVEAELSSDEVKHIAGNQNDVVKAVQNLPGVARAPFGTGQLVVWGTAPSDTRAYADGVLIPRVYHFGGVRSTISAEFVSSLRFLPGAYGADHGRGLGGVVEIATRVPRSDRLHGSVTLDLIDGGVTLEGPLSEKLHFAVGARGSWISAFLPLFNKSSTQLSPFYWDYQLALRYAASGQDDLDLLVFGATSDVTAKVDDPDPTARVDIDSKSYFGRARLRYTHRFSKDTTLWVMPSLGGDAFAVNTHDLGLGGAPVRLKVVAFGYNLRAELRQRLLAWLQYAAGLDFEGSYAQVETLGPAGPVGGYGSNLPVGGGDTVLAAGRAESGFLGAGFFSDSSGPALLERLDYHLASAAPYLVTRFFLGERLELSPQLRISIDHTYLESSARAFTPSYTRLFWEPRLGLRIALVPSRVWLLGGLGIYHQAPQGAELSPAFGNPFLLWQVGTTYTVGLEANLENGLHIEAQGFYKDLRNLVIESATTRYNNDGLGRVYGGELLLRQPLWRGISGWVAYTLSRSERRARPDEPWRLFQFDQTHILTLIASYELPRGGLVFGARFRYVTGNPTTPFSGGVRNLYFQSYQAIVGEMNSIRLPDFHQLDIRVDKTFVFNRFRLGVYLEVQNLYNRHNAESLIYGGRQLSQQGQVTGLPIFPNLGFRADF